MSGKIKTAIMEIIKAHMDGEDKNTKAVLSDVMESVRETLEQEPCEKCIYSTKDGYCQYDDISETIPPLEPCDECRNKRTSFCGNCNEYDEFEPCDDVISRKTLLTNLYQYKISCAGRIQAAILEVEELVEKMPPVTPKLETVTEFADRCRECGARYGKLLEQKSGKWIDIDEQKPDVGISVLVCDDEEDIYLTHITRDGVFFDEWGNKIKGIVAWMPLPEPYKTESEVEE